MNNNIRKILKEQNRSLYWLSKETKISYPTLTKLANNESDSIKFNNMSKICKALNCDLNYLFEIDKNKRGE